MKKILISIIALLPTLAFAQAPAAMPGTFTIQGKVGALNAPARAFLFYQLVANKVVDSADIVQGSFKLTGTVMDPSQAFLVVDHKGVGSAKLDNTSDLLNLFIEKGIINVASATDSVAKAEITGSAVNDDNKKLMEQLKPVMLSAQKLYAESQAATPAQKASSEFQASMEAKQKELQQSQTTIFINFVKANPNSYLSLLALSSLGPTMDPSQLEPLYSALAQNLKDMEAGKMLKKSIDALKPVAIGAIAPDFTQNDVNGTPVKLSSFRGKYVLLDFWASWCGPCRAENPNVVHAYNKFKTKNFTVLGVSLDKQNGKADWLAAIKADGLTWTQVSDLNFWNNQAALLYAVQSIPHNFLIDPNGKIIAKDLRGSDLDAKLTTLFGKM